MTYVIEVAFESEKAMTVYQARDAITRAFGLAVDGHLEGDVSEEPTNLTGSKARFVASVRRDLDADYEVAARKHQDAARLEDALRGQFVSELDTKHDGLSVNDRLDDDGLCVSLTTIRTDDRAHRAFTAACAKWIEERGRRAASAGDTYREDLIGHARILARRGEPAERSWPPEAVDAYNEVARRIIRDHLARAQGLQPGKELTLELERLLGYVRAVTEDTSKTPLTTSS